MGALAELATLGTLVPLLTSIASDGDVSGSGLELSILGGWAGRPRSLITLALLFAASAALSGVLRIVLLWAINRFVNGVVHELAVALFQRVLHEPFENHARRNSSEIIASVNKIEILGWNVLMPAISATVALAMSLAIGIGLLTVEPMLTLAVGAIFTSMYLLVLGASKRPLQRNGRVIAAVQRDRVKALQEGLGGIREVLLDGSQNVFLEPFERAMAALGAARTRNAFIAGSPRFVVEAVAMMLLAALTVALSGREGGLSAALPFLGALALGAQRLLPLIQQTFFGWASALGNRQVVLDVLESLGKAGDLAPGNNEARVFKAHIRFEEVAFRYAEDLEYVLHDVNVAIPKGARVGVIGKTGSGKSTFIDLLLGLLKPTSGRILIDSVDLHALSPSSWQRIVAHVPQAIFLADASIGENIAFGVRAPDVQSDRVQRAVEQAELSEDLRKLPRGLDTVVGERGVKLSGGQRQRIGIARALYKSADVIVLDEATSALDEATERSIMETVIRLDPSITVVIVAHHLPSLSTCDIILSVDDGRVSVVRNMHPQSSSE